MTILLYFQTNDVIDVIISKVDLLSEFLFSHVNLHINNMYRWKIEKLNKFGLEN